jgi:hypothetical protein
MISGFAPGMLAETLIAGLSVFGSDATGNREKATQPVSAKPKVSNVVATGRAMNGPDKFKIWPRPFSRP